MRTLLTRPIYAAFRVSLLLIVILPTLLLHGRLSAAGATSAGTAVGLPPTIVAIGDSITAGSYDTDVKGGWVTRLAAKLNDVYPQVHLAVRNAGIGGDTSWGVLARLRHDVMAVHPRLVIISIGTNDFNSGVPAPVYADRLQTIVARLASAPHPPVLVLASLLPFAGLTPARLRAEEDYNDIIRRTAAADDIGYLDLFDQWLALGSVYWHTLRHDSVHPNPIGYELLASVTAAFLEAGYVGPGGDITAPAIVPTCADSRCGALSRARRLSSGKEKRVPVE